MKPGFAKKAQANLPATAQTSTGVFGFLFNILDLLTAFFTLFDLFGSLFGPGNATA